MTERLLFSAALVRVTPPWLQRLVGGPTMRGLADPLDTLVENTVAAVKARFPSALDVAALARIGRERRIRQGLGESAATYITRILPWWDVHRTRGNAYALLGQLDAFYQDWLNVRMDVVSNLGNRHWIDDAAALADSVITHDGITWGGDAQPGKWARFWLFFYLPADTIPSPIGGAFIVTDDGSFIVTDDGSFLVTDGELTASALSAAEIEMFSCIAREWSAAHIDRITVVLFYGEACLVGYPPRLVGDNPPNTVTPAQAPTMWTIED